MPYHKEKYPDYLLVQAAVGCTPAGHKTNSRIVGRLSGVIPPQVNLYTHKMKCLTFGEKVNVSGRGDSAREMTRDFLPDPEACDGCDAIRNCILLLIKEHPANRNRVPESMRNEVIV